MPSPLDDLVKKAKGSAAPAGDYDPDGEEVTALGKKMLKAFETRNAELLGSTVCELIALKNGGPHGAV